MNTLVNIGPWTVEVQPVDTPLTAEELNALKAFALGQAYSLNRAPHELCVRDGHQPALRWRGLLPQRWRCQRCGEECAP